jgi:hypothetical protein
VSFCGRITFGRRETERPALINLLLLLLLFGQRSQD